MFDADDIEAWAAEYADAPDVKALLSLIEADRSLPQPSALKPGSPERQIAQARQDQIARLAVRLGYKPPVRQTVEIMAAEMAKSAVLGATGLSETSVGETLDKLPAPEKSSRAEREEDAAKQRRRSRSPGLGLERML